MSLLLLFTDLPILKNAIFFQTLNFKKYYPFYRILHQICSFPQFSESTFLNKKIQLFLDKNPVFVRF